MGRLPRALALLTLLAGEAAAVAVLLRSGARPPFAIPLHDISGWLRAAPPTDALAAVLRLAAIATAGWLLIGTTAYTVARAVRAPAAIRATAWATIPTVRRIVDAALAVSIVAGSVTAPFAAGAAAAAMSAPAGSGTPPAGSTVRDGRATTTTPGPLTDAEHRDATAIAAPLPAPSPATVTPTTVIVAAGDDLWRIASTQLAAITGREVGRLDPALVVGYWRALCDTNRTTLRSGDVNLIFPGEVLTLPPPPPAPPPG